MKLAIQQDGELVMQPIQLVNGALMLSVLPINITDESGIYLDPVAYLVQGDRLMPMDDPI